MGDKEHEELDDDREENGNGEDEEEGIHEEPLAAEQLTKLHAQLDANGDGKVALNEIFDYATAAEESKAKADIDTLLSELDTSKDGKLSLEEHLTDIANMGAEENADVKDGSDMEHEKKLETDKFNAADANGDRLLDKSELPALLFPELNDKVLDVTVRETIRMKDANHDGKLSPQEFWEATEDEHANEKSDQEELEFKQLDANGDGLLDAQELLTWESGKFHMSEAMTNLIKLADTDGDKHLTADELVKASTQIAMSDAQFHLSEWIQANEL